MVIKSIKLRPATEADLPALVRLLRRSWLVAWAPELPFEAVQAFAAYDPARMHAETSWRAFIVADSAGDLAGMFHITGDVVEDLHVDPTMWGQGIGSLLLSSAEHQIGLAHPTARLEVRAFNLRALSLYVRRGWVETRRYPGSEGGSPVENVEMTKDLRGGGDALAPSV